MAESIAAAGAVSAQMDVPVPTAAHMFDIAVACLVITALAAWFNVRFIRLPNTIGVMAIAMLAGMAGLRLQEAAYLRHRDIDWAAGTVTVTTTPWHKPKPRCSERMARWS